MNQYVKIISINAKVILKILISQGVLRIKGIRNLAISII